MLAMGAMKISTGRSMIPVEPMNRCRFAKRSVKRPETEVMPLKGLPRAMSNRRLSRRLGDDFVFPLRDAVARQISVMNGDGVSCAEFHMLESCMNDGVKHDAQRWKPARETWSLVMTLGCFPVRFQSWNPESFLLSPRSLVWRSWVACLAILGRLSILWDCTDGTASTL